MLTSFSLQFMTKQEALEIPSMRINVTPFVEDCFYALLGQLGMLSKERAEKALINVAKDDNKKDLELYYKGMLIAGTMIENIKKYGVACADWCE